jgi:hypothetical protein
VAPLTYHWARSPSQLFPTDYVSIIYRDSCKPILAKRCFLSGFGLWCHWTSFQLMPGEGYAQYYIPQFIHNILFLSLFTILYSSVFLILECYWRLHFDLWIVFFLQHSILFRVVDNIQFQILNSSVLTITTKISYFLFNIFLPYNEECVHTFW